VDSNSFQEALKIGRPPNIVKLFSHSQAILVSSKFMDQAMIKKGQIHLHRR
jgi:hypothetical protein